LVPWVLLPIVFVLGVLLGRRPSASALVDPIAVHATAEPQIRIDAGAIRLLPDHELRLERPAAPQLGRP
jgi:hypothetical protein